MICAYFPNVQRTRAAVGRGVSPPFFFFAEFTPFAPPSKFSGSPPAPSPSPFPVCLSWGSRRRRRRRLDRVGVC